MFQNNWFCNVSLTWSHFMYFWIGFISNFDCKTKGFLHVSRRVFQNHWFFMFLWGETIVLIFEMVSFQALLIQPEDFCLSYKGYSKTIGFVISFYWNHSLDFWNGFISNCAYIFFVFLNILEIQWQKHGFIMFASKTKIKALLLSSKPIWEPNRTSW